jgi:hypothetical protein
VVVNSLLFFVFSEEGLVTGGGGTKIFCMCGGVSEPT